MNKANESSARTREFARSLEKSQADSLFPFMIFNEKFSLIAANKVFKKAFGFKDGELPRQYIDFLMLKETDALIPLSALAPQKITGWSGLIEYRQGELELKYYMCIFPVGAVENEMWYYSLLKETSEIEQKVLESSLHALIKASLLKDNDTGNHVRRVNAYSRCLTEHCALHYGAQYPEINSYFIEKISYVAAMHDVGKIGTPDSILTKPGRLTVDEFEIIKEHTINGAFILSSLAGEMARDVALFHHEKWDGSGYPYGLKGTEIPLSARIVSVADVYDALRMRRYYKPAYDHEKARGIIIEGKGTHFDPALTDVFLEINQQFERVFNELADEEEAVPLEELQELEEL
jgi:putative two-component system response regulator